MVSARCEAAVEKALLLSGLQPITVSLGEAEIAETPSDDQLRKLNLLLLQSALELILDKRSILTEKIRAVIIDSIYYSEEPLKVNFSYYLSQKLAHDYTYMSNLFSETQGTTIEQFIISHKIAKIKELVNYNELNITQIAWKMNYSSVAHLSNQFKKVTGLSPSQYKQLKEKSGNLLKKTGIVKPISKYIFSDQPVSYNAFQKNPQIALNF